MKSFFPSVRYQPNVQQNTDNFFVVSPSTKASTSKKHSGVGFFFVHAEMRQQWNFSRSTDSESMNHYHFVYTFLFLGAHKNIYSNKLWWHDRKMKKLGIRAQVARRELKHSLIANFCDDALQNTQVALIHFFMIENIRRHQEFFVVFFRDIRLRLPYYYYISFVS